MWEHDDGEGEGEGLERLRRRVERLEQLGLEDVLESLTNRMDVMEASQAQNQASIDADTAKATANEAKLVTVQQEVDALKVAQSQGQALDFSKLDAALATEGTQADVDVADAAPPAPPAPAVPPAPPAA